MKTLRRIKSQNDWLGWQDCLLACGGLYQSLDKNKTMHAIQVMKMQRKAAWLKNENNARQKMVYLNGVFAVSVEK